MCGTSSPATAWAGGTSGAARITTRLRQVDPPRAGPPVRRGGGGSAEGALPAAVAVELVRDFSLLHDDVMDGDATRAAPSDGAAGVRGEPGDPGRRRAASLAFAWLAGSGHPLAHEGAGLAERHGARPARRPERRRRVRRPADVTLPECMRMAGSKTGALIACACALGALYGAPTRRPSNTCGLRRRAGAGVPAGRRPARHLGRPGGDRQAGVLLDLANRKKSPPVVAALDVRDRRGGGTGRDLPIGRVPSEAELARAADLVERAGGRDWCREDRRRLLARAAGHLADAGCARPPAAELAGAVHR